jgi:hypothetical protein
MTIKDVKEMYGNWALFVNKTGFGRTSWFSWSKKGYVPIKSQFKLQEITKGALKADYEDIPK